MKKLIFLCLLTPVFLSAQTTVVQMGGVSFVDCKSLVAFGGHDVVSIHQNNEGAWLLNAEVYNEAGRISATIHDNQTTAGNVILTQTAQSLSLSDRYTGRVICHFDIRKSADGKQTTLATTLNLYLPNGTMLRCTPEASNQTVLETMRGKTIQNKEAALQITQ